MQAEVLRDGEVVDHQVAGLVAGALLLFPRGDFAAALVDGDAVLSGQLVVVVIWQAVREVLGARAFGQVIAAGQVILSRFGTDQP